MTNTPDVLTETVADTIFALMLASARRVVELDEFVKAGHWRQSIDETLYGVDVHSKVLGILGMGRIGTAVARRARLGFSMEVLYYNRSRNREVEDQFNAKFSTFDDILGAADFLCVVLPSTKKTEKLIGAPEFAKMKRGAIFINGSRGHIVDQSALIRSLQTGHLGAAGLDPPFLNSCHLPDCRFALYSVRGVGFRIALHKWPLALCFPARVVEVSAQILSVAPSRSLGCRSCTSA